MPGWWTWRVVQLPEFIDPASDQASGLRRLFEKQAPGVIAVTSAHHGGTHLFDRVRLLMQLAADQLAAGSTLTLLDEHPGAGGIAHAYGVVSGKDFKHALHGSYPLDEVTFSPLPGLMLIPAPRAAGMAFTLADEAALAGNVALLKRRSDCIMINCAPRVRRALSPIAACADQLLVLVTAKDEDLTRAYGLIKRATLEKNTLPIAVAVMHACDTKHAKATYEKLRRVAFDHLGIRLHYQGAALTPGARRLSLTAPYASPCGSGGRNQPGSMRGHKEMADSMV